MQVTGVKVFTVAKDDERLKAFATIIFDDCFIVRDLKIIDGTEGLFVAMPSKKRKDGQYKDVAHPLNNDMREIIESAVLVEYKEEVERVVV